MVELQDLVKERSPVKQGTVRKRMGTAPKHTDSQTHGLLRRGPCSNALLPASQRSSPGPSSVSVPPAKACRRRCVYKSPSVPKPTDTTKPRSLQTHTLCDVRSIALFTWFAHRLIYVLVSSLWEKKTLGQ